MERFVEAHPEGRLGHTQPPWSGICPTPCGLEPCFLAARASDGELGVLPLVTSGRGPVAGPRWSRSLFSTPPGSSRPTETPPRCAPGDGDLSERRFGPLELRESRPAGDPGAVRRTRPGQSRPALKASEETQWTALSTKVRNQCRKADREGWSAQRNSEALRRARSCFLPGQHARSRLPPHAERFFAAVIRRFGERCRFIVTEHAGRPVGGLVAIRFGRRVCVPQASTLRSERSRCPNNQIYWEAIRWAIAGGASDSTGRSPQDGVRFKKG
ncbi:MAG: GNAT family N-acetyltransferase [Myxococcota bacterium]